MKSRFAFILLLLVVIVQARGEEQVVFTKATDLYYGTAYSKQYNHQLWLTTEGLTYDPVKSEIEGTDGMVMRLDLMCPSATNIAGTYEIVGPKDADAPYKMNKKYTYWTYFEQGGFLDQKLTIGTCTIACTSKSTYTISYDVQEIDKGATHKGTITNIAIHAVKENGQAYTLVPTCTNNPTKLEETAYSQGLDCRKAVKIYKDGQMYILRDGKIYNTLGQEL